MDLTDIPTKAPIVSETLVIKPENQKDITRENQNRNVRFLIPNYVGYFLPSQSNFSFSITMEGRGNPIPSRDAGLHSLFNVVRTYDVTNSHLLEEVIQYNTLVAQKFQYGKSTSIDNYRAEFEGVQPNKSIDNNLYWKPDQTTYAGGTVVSPDVAKTVQFSGTIKTDFYDSDKFIPCAVFNGLRTEIQMEDYRRALEFTTGSLGVGSANGMMPKQTNLMVTSKQAAVGAEAEVNPFTATVGGAEYQVGFIYTATVAGVHIGFVEVTALRSGTTEVDEAVWYATAGGHSPPEAGAVIVLGTPTAVGAAAATLTVKAGQQIMGGIRITNANDEYFVDLGSTNVIDTFTGTTSPGTPAQITYFGDGSVRKPFQVLNQIGKANMGYGDTTCFPNVAMPFSVGDRLFIGDLAQTTASKKALGIITRISKLPAIADDKDRGARIHFVPLQELVLGPAGAAVANETRASTLTGGTGALLTQNYMFSHALNGFAFFVEEADRLNKFARATGIPNRTVAPTKAVLDKAADNVVNFSIHNLQYNVKRVDMDENIVAADLRAANSSGGYRLDLATTQTRLVIATYFNSKYNQSISSIICSS